MPAEALLSAVLSGEPLNQSAAALGGSFAPADWLEAKPLIGRSCDWIRASMGRMRRGRITVWNTRIAAHRTTTHFFRHPLPPRAGAVLVLIQYHATRPGGIAAPPSPAPRVRYAPGLHRICARAARAVLLRIAPRLYAVYASRNLRTQQNILFAAFKRLFARHVFALSALFCIFNVLSVYQSKASVISPNPPRIRSCTSPDALTSFLSTSAAPSKS